MFTIVRHVSNKMLLIFILFNKVGGILMKKIKVLYILSSLVKKGPNVVVYNIIKNLDFNKFEPYLLTFRENKSSLFFNDFLSLKNLMVIQEDFVLPYDIKKINKVLYEIKPDVVHSNGISADFCNAFSTNFGQKKVSTLHGLMYEHYISSFGFLKGSLYGLIHNLLYIRIHWRIGCSKAVTKSITSKFLKASHIKNGLDVDVVNNYASLQTDDPIIIFVGSLDQRKNVKTLLKSFSKSSIHNKFKLLLVGNGPLKETLEAEYESDRIVFVGFVDDPLPYIRNSSFLVLPSFNEGFPLVVIESLSVGTPVLLSKIPPHEEIFELSNDIGVLFEPSEEGMINMFNMLDCYDFVSSRKNCTVVYQSYLTSQIMSQDYMKLYLE